MLRLSVLDKDGRLVTGDGGAINVSFAIVSGPGVVVGVGNGDPGSQCAYGNFNTNVYILYVVHVPDSFFSPSSPSSPSPPPLPYSLFLSQAPTSRTKLAGVLPTTV